MILLYVLAVVAAIFAGWRAWRRTRFFLHIFQLEGYRINQFVHWVTPRARRLLIRTSHMLGALTLVLAWLIANGGSTYWTVFAALLVWPILFASSRIYRSAREKKPLKYTPRLLRLLVATGVVTAAWVAVGVLLGLPAENPEGFLWFLGGLLVADLGVPLWIIAAALALGPVEAAVQSGFKRRARRSVIRHPNLTIVGITGSYGKTSVKFIIAAILSRRFSVLATPGSYNTPMGISVVVNQKLRPEHQFLILEMGARYAGDIRELCDIARPDVAVVTSVGVAHLETMGSIQEIAREKGSLLTYSKDGAIAVLNGDDRRVEIMAANHRGHAWLTYATPRPEAPPTDEPADEAPRRAITARSVRYDAEGTSFVVADETGEELEFRTRLLGLHNVGNILLGVAVGRAMGLRLRQIARAVADLKPVEHRLELKREGPLTIIDDAFNSNPVGARNAVEILGQFNSGRRIIVTPGMIELGSRQTEENREFGRHIAKHADLAILVGAQQTLPIQQGLRDENYPLEQVRVVSSLFEARDALRQVARAGDVVLFENDLPDQY